MSDRRSESERVLRNTGAILAGRLGGQGLRLLAMLRAAAHLDAAGFGVLGYVVSSLEVFRVLASFGLETVTVRALALGQPPPQVLMRRLFLIKTGTAVLAFLLLVGLTFAVDSLAERRSLVLLLGTALLPQALGATLTSRLLAAHAMERLVPYTIVTGAVQLVAVHLAAEAGLGVGAFIAILAAVEYLSLGAVALANRGVGPFREGQALPAPIPPAAEAAPRPVTRALLRQALPLAALELVVIVYSRLGVFFVERQAGLPAVGRYYAALRLTEPLVAAGAALAVSLLPVFARLIASGDAATLSRRFRRTSLLATGSAAGVAAILSLIAEPLLAMIRPEYAAAAGVLRVLAWAAVPMVQNQLSSTVIHASGRYHVVTACSTVNLGVFLGLAFLLVPRFGPLGAALATLGTESLNAVVQLSLVRRWIQETLRRDQETALAGTLTAPRAMP